MTSERRRRVLAVLFDAGRALDERRLARRVVARSEDADPVSVADERVDEMYLALRHGDLPKLDDAGAIVHHDAAGEVELGPASDDLRPLLRYARTGEL